MTNDNNKHLENLQSYYKEVVGLDEGEESLKFDGYYDSNR